MSRKEKWEMTLKRVDSMIASSNANLFDRVTLLCQVWDNPEFLAHHQGNIDAAEEHLDQKVGDYGLGFMELRALLKYKPRRTDWETGNLRVMLAEALEAETKARKIEQQSTPARKGPVPRKEHEIVVQQLERATERNEQQADEIGRLRQRVAELERENAMLRGRVEQLERMMERQAA